MIIEVRPDNEVKYDKNCFKIFLAGTIDNGSSHDWQSAVLSKLCYYNLDNDSRDFGCDFSLGADFNNENVNDIVVFNPRRPDWNPEWGNKEIENQIRWEQEKLDEADLIAMIFIDGSKSPISLLELGLYGPSGKVIVFCTERFYRYSNIKVTCEKYLIDLHETQSVSDITDEIAKIYKEFKNE